MSARIYHPEPKLIVSVARKVLIGDERYRFNSRHPYFVLLGLMDH